MPGDALRIYCDTHFPAAALARLSSGVGAHALLRPARTSTSNLDAAPFDDSALHADVLFGQPSLELLRRTSTVRWVHLTSAGYERYADPAGRALLRARGVRLTTSSSVYADPCAQTALAMMLASARQLLPSYAEQRGARAWSSAGLRRQSTLLTGARVLLVGYGAIARRLAALLQPFGVDLVALRRRVDASSTVSCIGWENALGEFAAADHVVVTLPGGTATRGRVDRRLLSAMASHAWIYNLGRGTTLDQAALCERLHAGQLAGAYLDVTDPEPLPADHPLWEAPHCYVTPHIAGGQRAEPEALVEGFLANLHRYERGEPLVDEVSSSSG